MHSRRIHFADETLFPKKTRNYDVKKYRKELENQILTSNKKKQFIKIMDRFTPKKITKKNFDNFDDNFYTKKDAYFDTLMDSMSNSIKKKNKIYDEYITTHKKKNKKKNNYNDFFQITNSFNYNPKKLIKNQTCKNWKLNNNTDRGDSITNYIKSNKKIKTARENKKINQGSFLLKKNLKKNIFVDKEVKDTLLNENNYPNNDLLDRDINDQIDNKNNSYNIYNNKMVNSLQKKKYNTFYKSKGNEPLMISDFDNNIKDVLKERKLEEKRKKFEKYVEQDLPKELNHYIKNYFDCSFINFQKEIKQNQENLNKELLELKRFTNILQKGEKRAYHDLGNLKREMKTLHKCELERRNKVYESLKDKKEVHLTNKIFGFKKNNMNYNFYEPNDGYKKSKEYSVKDILDSFENLINY